METKAHKCRPNIIDGKCSVCGRDESLLPPDYINKKIKKVSRKELLKALKEVNDKNEAQRRADNQAVSDALSSGFYCTGGRSNIKPMI
jgi:hypothetical protein